MNMSNVKIGIVSYGKVARLQAKAISGIAGVALDGVYGRDIVKARTFAGDFGITAYDSIAAMGKAGIDAVIISSPHLIHREQALEAFRAGMHVLVEKPMAITTVDCDAMIEASLKAGKTLGVISQRRWFPAVRRVHDAIAAGKIGVPILGDVVIFGWRDEKYYRSDPWRGSWSGEGGGVLVNQAVHQLDLLLWYMGPVAEVHAYCDNLNHPYIEVEDTRESTPRCMCTARTARQPVCRQMVA